MTQYEEVRPLMKTGDLLLWSGLDPVSLFIRLRTWSRYSHASMVLRLEGPTGFRIFHNNTVGRCVTPEFLSLTLKRYHGRCTWYPLTDAWDSLRPSIEQKMWEHVGVGFDFIGLFGNILGDVQADERKLYCSEDYFTCLGGKGKIPTPSGLLKLGVHKAGVYIK